MKKILITGAGGYFGANLTRHFTGRDYQVHACVRPSTDLHRISSVLSQITLHHCDITDAHAMKELVQKVKPDIIIHAAAYGIVPKQQDKELLWKTNFEGAKSVLDASETVPFDCFINIGSYLEYGKKNSALTEEMSLEPDTEYGKAKAAGTKYCEERAHAAKLPIMTLRLFSLMGNDESPHRLLPSLAQAYQRGERPQLSSPDNRRDFLFIEDALSAVELAIKNPAAGTYNVCTGEEHSVREVAEIARAQFPTAEAPVYGNEGRAYEYAFCKGSYAKFHALTGWKPRFTFSEAVKKSVAWHIKNTKTE